MIERNALASLTPKADGWLVPLNLAIASRDIMSAPRLSMFLATILYESNGFMQLVENLSYSAGGLLRVWPGRFNAQTAQEFARKPERIANRAYANRNGNGDEDSGDGWRFRGRGATQLTGRANYAAAERACGLPLVAQPELLEEPFAGAAVSAWFWAINGCNGYADDDDFESTQGIVNRGDPDRVADNMPARLEWLRRVKEAFGS